MQTRTDLMHVNTSRSQSAPLPYVSWFRKSNIEGRNHPLRDHTLGPCDGVHHARHWEDGLVDMKCVAEGVVVLSYTEVSHTIMEHEKHIEM